MRMENKNKNKQQSVFKIYFKGCKRISRVQSLGEKLDLSVRCKHNLDAEYNLILIVAIFLNLPSI